MLRQPETACDSGKVIKQGDMPNTIASITGDCAKNGCHAKRKREGNAKNRPFPPTPPRYPRQPLPLCPVRVRLRGSAPESQAGNPPAQRGPRKNYQRGAGAGPEAEGGGTGSARSRRKAALWVLPCTLLKGCNEWMCVVCIASLAKRAPPMCLPSPLPSATVYLPAGDGRWRQADT